ncbi:hypothetical protein HPB52_012717 [Rhipicephalus sanguineus]|uniref:Tick transposon n=1 Tax=Rhipicephalus sanguineus TaxID=34632 RepID=A0A9D4T5R9_RHISA|nr:hypothetical protein HPB52_012717 [Rhipicephalus sanguineus]
MASTVPPPLFLSTPGDPPIPWDDWKFIFQAYTDAAGKDASKPERRKALLLNALGQPGLKIFYTLNAANASATTPSSDVFKVAVALFDEHFKHTSCDYIERLKCQERLQLPGEPVADFISSLRSLAASCWFGAMSSFAHNWSSSLRIRCSSFPLRGYKAPTFRSTGRANMAALSCRSKTYKVAEVADDARNLLACLKSLRDHETRGIALDPQQLRHLRKAYLYLFDEDITRSEPSRSLDCLSEEAIFNVGRRRAGHREA